jgi:hypothetical protein
MADNIEKLATASAVGKGIMRGYDRGNEGIEGHHLCGIISPHARVNPNPVNQAQSPIFARWLALVVPVYDS